MTDTTQGGPAKGALAKTATTDALEVDRDPKTGINRDQPANMRDVLGTGQDHGERFAR